MTKRRLTVTRGTTIKQWYDKGKVCDENDDDDDFSLYRVWKAYKKFLSRVPKKPLRGPPKWTVAERSEFEVEGSSNNQDFFF